MIKYIKIDAEYYSGYIQQMFLRNLGTLIDDKHGLIILCKLVEFSNTNHIKELCNFVLTQEE